MEISNFDFVLLSIWEEYTKDEYTKYKNINQRDLDLETEEFISILKDLQNKELITGVTFSGGGNLYVPWLDKMTLTDKALEYISNLGRENVGEDIGYEKTKKNIKISSLLQLVYDELKDIGTTIMAKYMKE